MGFEEFYVGIYPKEQSPLYHDSSAKTLHKVIEEIQAYWPAMHPDHIEIDHLPRPRCKEDDFLYQVYETSEGLFQLFAIPDNCPSRSLTFSLRFAYCNPRTIYKPFCAMVEWLMQRYQMICHIGPSLAPEQQEISDDRDLEIPADVRATLIPSMDYNRRLWQSDAATEEEAILRPGDAVARFIWPQLVHDVSQEKSLSVPAGTS